MFRLCRTREIRIISRAYAKVGHPIFYPALSHAIISETGEMTEWLKVPVLKTGVGTPYRGFESHSLRHVGLTRTLGSKCVAEGCFYFSI